MKAATATTGFFQTKPALKNQYSNDHSLVRTLEFFLPKHVFQQAEPELFDLGQHVVSPIVFEWIADAESNLPYIQQQDTWGNPLNKLVTSEGWKRLKAFGIKHGVVSCFYEQEYGQHARVIGFAKNYLFSPSSAFVTCPFAMTDGCARACQLFGPFEASGSEYFEHLVSNDPSTAWTSGQWMTERPGGSDVSRTETVAVPDFDKGPKQYKLSGFKWFSSATDSQVTITLARIEDDKRLTCFIAPVTESVEKGNIQLHRLKKKFGTSALPTAELELRDMNAEIVGGRGRGVATISTVLNITRVYSCIGSASFFQRALQIAKEYSLVRYVFQKRLCDMASHVKALAEQETLARGLLFLSMYAAKLLGVQEAGVEHRHEKTLNRIVPGIAKAYVCKKVVPGISECIEAVGGIGYLEFEVEFNVARLLRDAQVNPIWEGTTNVLSDDFIRFTMKNTKAVVDAIEWLSEEEPSREEEHQPNFSGLAYANTNNQNVKPLTKRQILSILKEKNKRDLTEWTNLASGAGSFDISQGEMSQHAREYLMSLAEVLISTLLVADANRTTRNETQDAVALEIATRWTLRDLSRSLFRRQAGETVGENRRVLTKKIYRYDDEVMNRMLVYGTKTPRAIKL